MIRRNDKTKNKHFVAAKDYPDIEIVLGAGALSGDLSGSMRNMLGITTEFFNKVYDGIIGDDAFGLVPIVMRPKSRGRIRLKSRNPFQWPRMEPNYFADPEDLETLVQGAKLVVALGESESFRKFGSRFHRRSFLGCESHIFGSDDYWRCCIKGYTSSLQHQVSSINLGNVVFLFACSHI